MTNIDSPPGAKRASVPRHSTLATCVSRHDFHWDFHCPRLSTGIAGLDELLGGGFIPGTLSVAVGATGIGKTQLGLQFAQAGLAQEGSRGIVFDMTARIDSQRHGEYARRMFDWRLHPIDVGALPVVEKIFDPASPPGDYLHIFDHRGRRVMRGDVSDDAWIDWQAELAAKLKVSIAFFYKNFTRGVRRAVIDGIEPATRPGESIQIELFEYIYHQIIRKESEWVARDLFRERYRANAQAVAAHPYDVTQVACLMLYTCHETMLDQLVERPLSDGDLLATANTVIYLGRIRDGDQLARGLYVAKHRGSPCSDQITRFQIDDHGLRLT